MQYKLLVGACALMFLSACKAPEEKSSQAAPNVNEPSGAQSTNAPQAEVPRVVPRDFYQRPYPGTDPSTDPNRMMGY